jgi:hypothetical protein
MSAVSKCRPNGAALKRRQDKARVRRNRRLFSMILQVALLIESQAKIRQCDDLLAILPIG